MAKAVKVFSGSNTSSITVYTVPAGRVAKVTFSYCLSNTNSVGGFNSLTVGGISVFSLNSNSPNNGFPAHRSFTSGNTATEASAGYVLLSSTVAYTTSVGNPSSPGANNGTIIPIEFYLGAGDTVVAEAMRYNFSAVEEF